MDIILFEDKGVAKLYPIAAARPAYDIRMAGLTLLEAVRKQFPKAHIYAEHRSKAPFISALPVYASGSLPRLYLSARLTPSLAALKELATLVKNAKQDFVIEARDTVAGVYIASGKTSVTSLAEHYKKNPNLSKKTIAWKQIQYPEEVIFFNRDAIGDNASMLTKGMKSKKPGVFLGKGVVLDKTVVCDASQGEIIVGNHTVVHPYVVLRGPLVIGESCIIKECSVIGSGTTIGPVCKIGGEVDQTIFDGYSNKQHYGYLGDSYIGEWVNLGAGTTVSNLKNTYANIRISGRDSGAQFLGTIMGDYAKSASNTSIFPGRTIGVSSHVYGMVTEDVPGFTAHIRPGKLYELPADEAVRIQKAMAVRRGVAFTDQDRSHMEALYVLSEKERNAAGVKKEKLSFK